MKPKQVYCALDPVDERMLNVIGETLDMNNSRVIQSVLSQYVAAVPHIKEAVDKDPEYQRLLKERTKLQKEKAKA